MAATSTPTHTNVLYTARAHTAAGRDGGTSRTDGWWAGGYTAAGSPKPS
jgi:hypothetical protein